MPSKTEITNVVLAALVGVPAKNEDKPILEATADVLKTGLQADESQNFEKLAAQGLTNVSNLSMFKTPLSLPNQALHNIASKLNNTLKDGNEINDELKKANKPKPETPSPSRNRP